MPLLLRLCPGPSPGVLQYFFIFKTFLPSAMTSSKDKGESKEKSILHYFPSLFEELRHPWHKYLLYPSLLQLLPTSHYLKVFVLPGT